MFGFFIITLLYATVCHSQITSQCYSNYSSPPSVIKRNCCPTVRGRRCHTKTDECLSTTHFDLHFHTSTDNTVLLNEFYPFLRFDNICCTLNKFRLCHLRPQNIIVFRKDLQTYLTDDLNILKRGLLKADEVIQKNVILSPDEEGQTNQGLTINQYFAKQFRRLRKHLSRTIAAEDIDFVKLTSLIYSSKYLVRQYELQIQKLLGDEHEFAFPFNTHGQLSTSDNATLDFIAFFEPSKTLNESGLLLGKALLYERPCLRLDVDCWWLQAVTVDMWLDAWSQYYARHYNPFYTGKVKATTLRVWIPFTPTPITIGQVFPTGILQYYYIFPQHVQNHVQHILTDSLTPVYLCGLFVVIMVVSLMWNECLYCQCTAKTIK